MRPKSVLDYCCCMVLATLLWVVPASAEAWKFGVMGDTQWKSKWAWGENPSSVAVGIIKQLNRQFIDGGVAFVIQVGDLTDKGDRFGAMAARAEAARELCDAGIAFYPLRGNHEKSQEAAGKFQQLYPQTRGEGDCTAGAAGFTSPFAALDGLSYSFDYQNARFILLDQFTRADGTHGEDSTGDNILDQLPWIERQLSQKEAERLAFVLGHKNLIGAYHQDTLFGASPAANPDGQNVFFKTLADNGVRYVIGGHDHNHLRSLVTSPDGDHVLQNIIVPSSSYKFFTPAVPANDETFNLPAPPAGLGALRELPIAQELYTVGYYIVTVDGPRVTVAYYGSDNGCGGTLGSGRDCDLTETPVLHFVKRETFGYSLNGKSFVIAQGESYSSVKDAYGATTAEILGGINGSSLRLHDGRKTVKEVNTGWTARVALQPGENMGHGRIASDALTLWGMADFGSEQTDVYVLSMSYDQLPAKVDNGSFGIASRDELGKWRNAVDRNIGGAGEKRFVLGKWREAYGLGTYGIDPETNTAWAVVNHDGDFAVVEGL